MTTPAVTLTDDQTNAINEFLDFLVAGDENFFVLQGAAGTGKSFLIKHLLETFYSKYQAYCLLLQQDVATFDIKITATTNQAAGVVRAFLGEDDYDISTIHSLLGLKVTNDRNTGKTSLSMTSKSGAVFQGGNTPLVFIDEASYIGQDLDEIIKELLAKQYGAKVILIGDKNQLLQVGSTFSAIANHPYREAVLNEIMRNSGDILKTGTQFRYTVESGIFQKIQYNNIDVIHADGPTFQQMISDSFLAPDWEPSTSKVVAWTNDRVQEYNNHIRKISGLPTALSVGELLVTNEFIQTNGKGGFPVDSEVRITGINPSPIENYGVKGRMIEINHGHVGFMPDNFKDTKALLKKVGREASKDRSLWKKYFEIKEDWLDLRAAFSSSIHKAQGRTYETVFVDLADIGTNWSATDVARLLYVAITRASKQVICYGELPEGYAGG